MQRNRHRGRQVTLEFWLLDVCFSPCDWWRLAAETICFLPVVFDVRLGSPTFAAGWQILSVLTSLTL